MAKVTSDSRLVGSSKVPPTVLSNVDLGHALEDSKSTFRLIDLGISRTLNIGNKRERKILQILNFSSIA